MSLTTTSSVSRGMPRQLRVMWQKRRCSILFHLLVPGGKCNTSTIIPVESASSCSLSFQSRLRAVAPTAVGGDQETFGGTVTFLAETHPPAANGPHSEFGRVMRDPDRYGCFIEADIVNAVGDRLPQLRIGKIMNVDLGRISFAAVGSPRILQVSQHFLLLRVDRQRRLPSPQLALHTLGDVLELRISIGMLSTFPCLSIRLQTEPLSLEQLADFCVADSIAHLPQGLRQIPSTSAAPTQWRTRIASRPRLHQRLECLTKSRLLRLAGFSSAPLATLSPRLQRARGIGEFTHPLVDRDPRESGRLRHGCNTAPPQRFGFHRRPTSSASFVQLVRDRLELRSHPCNNLCVRHNRRYKRFPLARTSVCNSYCFTAP